ncbi:MAG: class II aldolase/adducin family protein [Spirochaetes bacterium]|nr:class II aldolase/adducin family protein [Spirochaetota bacterium]
MYNSEWESRKLIIEIGKRLWQKGYVAANDGNISARLNKDELLATATGVSKGFMTDDMIIKIDNNGNSIGRGNKYRLSSEIKMHLEVLKQRKDVMAVIHAHPSFCTSFAVAGIPLNKCIIPEVIVTLGSVPIAPYGTPSTSEIPESIKPYIKEFDALLLANHGALTLGSDLMNAYFKMETLEHSSRIIYQAMQLGNVNVLQKEDVEKLMEVREKMNIPGKAVQCTYQKKEETVEQKDLIKTITTEVLERLKKSKETN